MIKVRETVTEKGKHIIGDMAWYEPYTNNLKMLFREYQREYGRCVSKVYIDKLKDSREYLGFLGIPYEYESIPVGWVFEKRVKYTDCPETYIQETWVEYRLEGGII